MGRSNSMSEVAEAAALSLLASLVLLDLSAAEHGDTNVLEWSEQDIRRTRLDSLRDIFVATKQGADPVYEKPIGGDKERLDDAEFYARIKSIDHDLDTFTFVVDLRSTTDDDPSVVKDWAATSEQSVDDLLSTGWSQLSPVRRAWFQTEIKPFLLRMERLDESVPDVVRTVA